jgi:hypothetical protein
MTRATRRYKDKSYTYYYCPTTKKHGCKTDGMIKESVLMSAVLDSVKCHIANVVSLELLIASLDAERVGRELAERLAEQLAENERRIDKIREFKAGLYENMMSGFLSKEEYKTLKAKYTADADILVAANARLQNEIDDAYSCKHERLVWLERFKQFANLDAINRKTVAILIKSIRILSKREITIDFNYQKEYDAAVEMSGGSMPDGKEGA